MKLTFVGMYNVKQVNDFLLVLLLSPGLLIHNLLWSEIGWIEINYFFTIKE